MGILSISSTVQCALAAIAIGCKSRSYPCANGEFFNWRRDVFRPFHITWFHFLWRLLSHGYQTLSPTSALLISTPSSTGPPSQFVIPAEVRAASQIWAPLFEKFPRQVNVFAVPFLFTSLRLASLKALPQQTSSRLLLHRVHPNLQAPWVPVVSIEIHVSLSVCLFSRVRKRE